MAGLEVGELSPLLIAPIGSQTLTTLRLTMGARSIDGLMSTVAACCPSLEEFQLFRDFEVDEEKEEREEEEEEEGEDQRWRTEVKEVALLLSKLKSLRIMSLNHIRFDDSLEAKEGLMADGSMSSLKGLALGDCIFGDSLLHIITASRSLIYLDIINGADKNFEGMEYTFKSRAEPIEGGGDGGRGVSDVISIVGERCGNLKG